MSAIVLERIDRCRKPPGCATMTFPGPSRRIIVRPLEQPVPDPAPSVPPAREPSAPPEPPREPQPDREPEPVAP